MGCDSREEVDFFAADGLGVDKRLPRSVLPCFDSVFLNVLAFVQPFHGDGAVEGDRLVEVDLEDGVAGWCGPEGGGIVVDGCCLVSSYGAGLGDEVVGVDAVERCAELLKAFCVGIGYAACVVGRDAQHELCAVAYGFVVDSEEFVDGVKGAFVVGVPEPVGFAKRSVSFDWSPAEVTCAVDDVPVLVWHGAAFGTDPAEVGVFVEGDVGEDEGVGLVGAELLDDLVEVVGAASAACSVEPELGEGAVVGG